MRRRILRVNDLLRQELSDLIARQMRDPRMHAMVSITEVRTASDMSFARVYVSILGSPEDKKEALEGLRHATAFLRHELGDRMQLRQIPALTFVQDDSIERGARILTTLKEVTPGPEQPPEP